MSKNSNLGANYKLNLINETNKKQIQEQAKLDSLMNLYNNPDGNQKNVLFDAYVKQINKYRQSQEENDFRKSLLLNKSVESLGASTFKKNTNNLSLSQIKPPDDSNMNRMQNKTKILYKLRNEFQKSIDEYEKLNTRENLDQGISIAKIDLKFQQLLQILQIFHEKSLQGLQFSLAPEHEAYEMIMDIEVNVYQILKNVKKELNVLMQQITDKTSHIEKLNERIKEYKEEVYQLKNKQIQNLDDKNFGMISDVKSNLIQLNYENARLEQEVQQLTISLQKNDITQVKKQMRELKKRLNNQEQSYQQQIQQLNSNNLELQQDIKEKNQQILTLQNSNLAKDNQIQFCKNEISNFQKQLALLGSKVDFNSEDQELQNNDPAFKLLQEKNRYREIALMQLEDQLVSSYRQKDLLKIIYDQKKKMKFYSESLARSCVINDQDTIVEDNNLLKQVSSFMSYELRKMLIDEANSSLPSSILNYGKNVFTKQMDGSGKESFAFKQKSDKELDLIPIERLQVYKPSFYSLVDQQYNEYVDKNKKWNNQSINSIDHEFFVTIRAILDAKYNEFLLYDDFRQYSKFPEFVYSWLTNFSFNVNQLQTVSIWNDNKIDIENVKAQFLHKLNNNKIQKLWEILAFREFLEEQSQLDELYFYLHTRFLLYKGPQTKNQSAAFEIVYYVPFPHVQSVIQCVFGNFDMNSREFLYEKLREKIKLKGQIQMIDSNLVLRILLEYYKKEKRYQYSVLQQLLESHPTIARRDNKVILPTFYSFKSFMDQHYPNITDLDKAYLFRECFSLGKGLIDIQVFWTVANETNFLVKSMKLKSFMSRPGLLLQKGKHPEYNGITPEQLNIEQEKQIDFMVDYFLDLKKNLKGVAKLIEALGIEKIIQVNDFYERRLSMSQGLIDLDLYSGRNIFFCFQKIIQNWFLTRNHLIFMDHLAQDKLTELNQLSILSSDLQIQQGLLELIDDLIVKNDKIIEDRNEISLKMQRLLKSKNSFRWFQVINKMLVNKINSLDSLAMLDQNNLSKK